MMPGIVRSGARTSATINPAKISAPRSAWHTTMTGNGLQHQVEDSHDEEG
jgi:hypothetical protein